MKNTKLSTKITLSFIYLLSVVLLILAIGFIFFMKFYVKEFSRPEELFYSVTISFYASLIPAILTLYSLFRLLKNILKDEIFEEVNTKYLSSISWCCLAVSIICFLSCIYFPFVSMVLIGFAALFVSLIIRVIKNVLENAIIIKNENELTI